MNVTDEQLRAFREGRLDPISDAALEEQLMVDPRLRARLGSLAPQMRVEAVWSDINHTIDQPRAGRLERVATRLGVPEPAARLAGATPSLTRAWAAGIVGIGFFSLILSVDPARGDDRFLSYLILAPLLVVASVAAAYGRSSDPTHELAIASPLSGARLLLWRTVAVAPTAALANAVIGVMLGAGVFTVAWILPAIACTFALLALSTAVSITRAAGIVAAVYVAIVGTVAIAATDNLAAFRSAGQSAAFLAAVVGAIVLIARRDRLEAAVRW